MRITRVEIRSFPLHHLTLDWGQRVEVRVAESKLQLAR
jgi:hypothetical protein